VSQRVYQLVGGYEDANDSNRSRHDPIYKLACGRLPLAQEELLASQPTITRLENHVSKREVAKMRSQMVEGFINRYRQAPQEIVLDIDGWDDPFYVKRGADSEARIKELKLGIQAQRLSCYSFIANQFRLLLCQAAYILMLAIRQAATGTPFATAQVERLRALLIKGADRVKVSARRVLVELAARSPFADELRRITQRFLLPNGLTLG
jgi:hypothetical protein